MKLCELAYEDQRQKEHRELDGVLSPKRAAILEIDRIFGSYFDIPLDVIKHTKKEFVARFTYDGIQFRADGYKSALDFPMASLYVFDPRRKLFKWRKINRIADLVKFGLC